MAIYINMAPNPISLIESLRNIGYSVETAVADLIDNSITAEAKNINLRFAWNSGEPWFAIADDGHGMTRNELIEAMRFGSMNPLKTRMKDDLGRFGLGMKTASFSQCKQLIVLSKKFTKIACCEWDLKYLTEHSSEEWKLSVSDIAEIDSRPILSKIYNEYLINLSSGTIVLWQAIDRIKENVPIVKQEAHFNSVIDNVRNHLELVFHRYLKPDPGKRKVWIVINGDDLIAFDPFNPGNLATQELEEQKIILEGEEITVQPYVLPHHNKVSRQEYLKYEGEGGYLNNQGFYVYRNRRLIIKGTWFQLIKKEEMNKLIRVKIDLPNSLDHLWKIDVKKAHAYPPENIRNELKQVINKIEVKGRKVYRQRGKKLLNEVKHPLWERKISAGKISYNINVKHPILKKFTCDLDSNKKEEFGYLINIIGSSFPIDLFYSDFANKPEQVEKDPIDEKYLEKLLKIFIDTWKTDETLDGNVHERLLSMDPFASNKETTLKLLEQLSHDDK